MSASNGDPIYRVSIAKNVLDEVKALIQSSPRDGEVIASLEQISVQLERDPWNFGEQRYHLSNMRLQVRIAVVSPIAVLYCVDLDRPIVYVIRFIALEGA